MPALRLPAQSAPYVWLGPGWYAWLVFGPDDSPDAFRRIVRRVCDDSGGVAHDAPPGANGTEYTEVRVGAVRLLLVRKPGVGVSLGAGWADLPLLLRVGATFGAGRRGWRWLLVPLLARGLV
jgi:hypothetical protein